MPAVDGGSVGIRAIPDFGNFGSLFSQGVRGAVTQAEGLGKELSTALGGGMKAGLALAGAGAAFAIADFVASSVREYDRLVETTRELDAVTGASAERTSLFAGVLRNLGIDANSAGRPLGILANNIQNHTQLFDRYGIAIAHTKDGQADLLGTLDNLRQAFAGSATETLRDAAAKNLLGRGFQTLIPYLELSNTQLKQFEDIARRSGEIFTQADLDNARLMAVNVETAKEHIEALKLSVGRDATAGVNNFFSGLNVLSKKTGVGDIPRVAANLTGLGQVLGIDLPHHIRNAVQGENDLSRTAAQTKIDLTNEAAAVDTLGTAIEGLHSAEEGVQSAEQGVQHAAEGVTKAQQGVQKAHEGTAKAVEGVALAQRNLDDFYRQSAEGADAVAKAQLGIGAADRGVRDATESLTDATKNLTEAQQFEAQDAASQLTDLHLSLASATLSLAQARRTAATAYPTVNDPFAQQRARLGVAQAVQNQKKAQEDLDKAQQFGTSAENNLTTAQRAARDAAEKLTAAFQSQDDARTALAEAEIKFDQQEADLQRAVRDARRSVTDAVSSEHDAEQSLSDAKQTYANSEQTLTDAKIKVRDATDKVNTSLDNEAAIGVNLNAVLDQLKAKYPELAGTIEQFYTRVVAARAAATGPVAGPPAPAPYVPGQDTRPPAQQRQSPPSSYDIRKAAGGRVVPGQTYVINEQGYERVTFDQPGTVHPANLTPAGGDGGSMPGAHSHPIYLNGKLVGEAMAEDMSVAQARFRSSTRGRQ
jgi:hypothetical protein